MNDKELKVDDSNINDINYMINVLRTKIHIQNELVKELVNRNEKLVNENNELKKQLDEVYRECVATDKEDNYISGIKDC